MTTNIWLCLELECHGMNFSLNGILNAVLC